MITLTRVGVSQYTLASDTDVAGSFMMRLPND